MNRDRLLQKYKCTQDEFYATAEMGINNLEKDLAAFAAKSTKYDTALVASLRLLRKNAMELPDEQQRAVMHETLRGQLPQLLEAVKADYRALQSYIRDGWPGEIPKPRYEESGLKEFNAIGVSNWEAVVTLNAAMKRFLANVDYAAKLANPGGMIAGFDGDVQTHFDAFDDVYQRFMTSRETQAAREAKIKANNKLYDACMRFMKFGKESVFRHDSGQKRRYTWSVLKRYVTPDRASSLVVKLKRRDDTLASKVEVRLKKEGVPMMKVDTNEKGLAVFAVAGMCEISVGDVKVVKKVRKGTKGRVTIVVS